MRAKTLLNEHDMKKKLLKLHPFRNLTENIVKLQAEDYTLVEQFEIINSTLKSLKGTALKKLRTSPRKIPITINLRRTTIEISSMHP